MAIKIGDVVRLKSGGPQMTVADRHGDDWVCRWFDSKNESHCESFPENLLQLVKDEISVIQPYTEPSPFMDFSDM